MARESISETFTSAWSKTIDGLSGRLRLKFEDLNPGLRYAIYLELASHAFEPITVINQPVINAVLFDESRNSIYTIGYPSSGPQPLRQWAVIPRDAYIGLRVDMQTTGVPTRDQQQVLLAVGGTTWRITSGRYSLKTSVVFKQDKDGPPNQWVGELDLPEVEIVVTQEMFSD